MPIVAEEFDYVMGVDTHAQHHCYVLINAATAATIAGPAKFATTTAGMNRAVNWCRRHTGGGTVLWAVEGTGCYGRLLTTLLLGRQFMVAEVRPPKKGGPKSDALDAAAAARSVVRLRLDQLAQPRTGRWRHALHIYCTARHALNKQVVADTQRLIALARTNDLGVDARHGLGKVKILAISHWRARPTEPIDIAAARGQAVVLARHILDTRAQLTANEKQLRALVTAVAPGLLDQCGVGPVTAAHLLVAWSHSGRFATEARFAMHAGVAPIPVGSGKTDGTRVRLNPGNDRDLNSAIYYITHTRIRHSDRTKTYVAKRLANSDDPHIIRRAVQRYIIRDLYRFLTTLNLTNDHNTPTTT